jgi:hypothetical protein
MRFLEGKISDRIQLRPRPHLHSRIVNNIPFLFPKLFGDVPEGPLKGRALGEQPIDQTIWRTGLNQYLSKAGIAEYAFVSQGNVVVYANGSESYIRNFSRSDGFRKSLFKGITSVRPSPLTQRLIPNTKL